MVARFQRLLLALGILVMTGIGSAADQRSISVEADSNIPPRAGEDSYAARSDAELWNHLEASARTAVVGLKAPGQRRGVWKGKVLVDSSQLEGAKQAVLSHPGVTLLAADTILPVITIKLDNASVLQTLRALPVVDYIEPLYSKAFLPSSSGCTYDH